MIHYVCGPFRTERLKLCVRAEVAGNTTHIPFDQDVIWNRSSESKIEFYHGGRLFKEGPTFNDYYGFMTSEKAAIQEATRLAEAYEITKWSSLTIRVKTTVSDTPHWRSPLCEKTDLENDRIRHQLEGVYDQSWMRAEDRTRLEAIQLSSTLVWDSRSDL